MKSQNKILLGSALLMALGLILQVGCETKSTDELEVVISPKRSTIMDGETITLHASGWTRYRWTLENPLWGVLSPTIGETVYYTATVATNGVQVVTVVGSGTSSAGAVTTGTNNTVVSVVDLTGEAFIQHTAPIPKEEEEDDDDDDDDDDDGQTASTATTTTATDGGAPPVPG